VPRPPTGELSGKSRAGMPAIEKAVRPWWMGVVPDGVGVVPQGVGEGSWKLSRGRLAGELTGCDIGANSWCS
jgi:hypothetical protein